MFDKLFLPELPVVNLMIRASVVFVAVVLLLRISGKRQMGQLSATEFVVILLINLLLLFVGMFMETIAALIILFVPLQTLALAVGIDPLHFAVFAVMNLMIGLTTPPVGVCLFVAANIARLPLSPVIRAITPYIITNLIMLLKVSYFPPLSTWLPNRLMP